MKLWPFSRKKAASNDDVPAEVKEYYESGRKQQTGMAWLLAFGTLVVTVVLALIIFFGGRWVYQRLTDSNEAEAPTKQQETASEQTPANPAQNGAEDTNANNAQQGTSSSNTSTPSTATNGSNTPTTGSSATEVPNTGPGPDGLQ